MAHDQVEAADSAADHDVMDQARIDRARVFGLSATAGSLVSVMRKVDPAVAEVETSVAARHVAIARSSE